MDVMWKHAHCLARRVLTMGSMMAGKVEGRCEVVVVKRKDVTCDAVARISNMMDWQTGAVHIPYMLTFVLINIKLINKHSRDWIPVALCSCKFWGTFWCQFWNEIIPPEFATPGIVILADVSAKFYSSGIHQNDRNLAGICGASLRPLTFVRTVIAKATRSYGLDLLTSSYPS